MADTAEEADKGEQVGGHPHGAHPYNLQYSTYRYRYTAVCQLTGYWLLVLFKGSVVDPE